LGIRYTRLDLDLLHFDKIEFDPIKRCLIHHQAEASEQTISSPASVLYRAPTHLRESSGHRYSPEHLLQRHQWAAFARSLSVFVESYWVNPPASTYLAENKPYQLLVASQIGLQIPTTFVANRLPASLASHEYVAVKALDSFFLRYQDSDLFFYTQRMRSSDLPDDACAAMPLVIQEYLTNKVDVRVTIVGTRCYAAETSTIIDGDWRLNKADAVFKAVTLPQGVENMCITLTRQLGLIYGAIDLARIGDSFYFLEINPTGEWAWIDDLFDGEITEAVANELITGAR
jgi:glutathione synthase/RimK-type ligase-like ATP-grasp enzyme